MRTTTEAAAATGKPAGPLLGFSRRRGARAVPLPRSLVRSIRTVPSPRPVPPRPRLFPSGPTWSGTRNRSAATDDRPVCRTSCTSSWQPADQGRPSLAGVPTARRSVAACARLWARAVARRARAEVSRPRPRVSGSCSRTPARVVASAAPHVHHGALPGHGVARQVSHDPADRRRPSALDAGSGRNAVTRQAYQGGRCRPASPSQPPETPYTASAFGLTFRARSSFISRCAMDALLLLSS
jgi:hypothetical protein